MYKFIIRPILFVLQPEAIHHLIINILKFGFKIPGVPFLVKKLYCIKSNNLKREFLGMTFENPVGFAAGFDKNAEVYNEFANFGFSFIEIGTVTPIAQPGNAKPRSFRLPKDSALINRMGFNNKGVLHAVTQLKKHNPKLIIGGNIGKNTATPNTQAINDYIYCFKELYNYVNYFVVNVSCPNISDLRELQDQKTLTAILDSLVKIRTEMPVKKPIMLKISPDLNNNQLDEVISIVKNTGIDGIVAVNTTISRENLTTSKKKVDNIANGGLSGKPLSKRSTEIIRYINKNSNGTIPIMGVGGIMSVEDAIEKIEAGASLIQLYTGFIYEGPGFVKKINKALIKTVVKNN
ncbi:MAG: quinone-dependent dihydroorotate dehydrogenase [Bacteroidota bacterium]|nr:quinone-dependent dihydroorotate dehydrogenase [Bacteroidota bacterium]